MSQPTTSGTPPAKHPATARRLRTELRLRELLDHDYEANAIVAAKDDKISRSHYARRMGMATVTMLTYRYVFEEYERRADIKTGPLKWLADMRKWLSTEYSARRLTLRDGKVDRQAFAAEFKLRGGTFMTRHPDIRALLEDFDARAKKDNYLPKSLEPSIALLVDALAGSPRLNSDRKTINLEEISRIIGIPVHRLGFWPYSKYIAQRQAEILEKVKSSRIDPFFHDRVFAFSDLSESYPASFLEKVGIRFKQLISGRAKAGAKNPYLGLFGLLEWIGKSSNEHCLTVCLETREHSRVVTDSEWEEAVFGYRAYLLQQIVNGLASKTSVDTTLNAIRTVLEGLSTASIVPALSVPLPSIKLANRSGSKCKSVAEVIRLESSKVKESDYLAFARARLAEARERSGLEVTPTDDNEFLEALAAELTADRTLPSDVALAIKSVLQRRLGALRARCVDVIRAAEAELQRGHELLAASQIDAATFESAYFGDTLTSYQRSQLLRANFPVSDRSGGPPNTLALANFLRLIETRHGRVPPSMNPATFQIYGQFFSKRYLELGGWSTILPLLIPSSDAVGAILTLYLVESGSNISVGRTLSVDCVESSDLEAHRRITGHKARAGGKPIITEFPEDSPTIRSLEWLVTASHALRLKAGTDSDRLFLACVQGRIQLITPHWYTAHFNKLVQSISDLRGVKLLPSMIRPSVLLEAALSNDGRLKTGIAIGQHSEATSQGYQQKWPTRLLYDQNIRRFSVAFETLILSSVDDAAEKMGLSAEAFNTRLNDLKPSGLGPHCSGNGVRNTSSGERCSLDCWNDCPHMLLVAEVNAIASLQLWQKALLAAQPVWERDRPERWDEVWLPWLCFTEVAQEKMMRGPLIKVWQAATVRAEVIASSDGYVAPRPW